MLETNQKGDIKEFECWHKKQCKQSHGKVSKRQGKARQDSRLLARMSSGQVKERIARENTKLHSRDPSSSPETRTKNLNPNYTHPGPELTRYFWRKTPAIPENTVAGRCPPVHH